jgi:P27 family predicted phage terminase small subunit
MRGRKPKPSHLKLVTGNPGKRPVNDFEAAPQRDLPLPPTELNDDAKVEWGRVSGELYRVGLLSAVDRATLAAYCQAYGRWMQAERVLGAMAKKDSETLGLMVTSAKGNPIQNPLIGVANKAMADMAHYAIEFGMTPSARSRIKASPPDEKANNPLAKFGL